MTIRMTLDKNGKQTIHLVRQMPHDPQYKIGSRIPGLGKVIAIG